MHHNALSLHPRSCSFWPQSCLRFIQHHRLPGGKEKGQQPSLRILHARSTPVPDPYSHIHYSCRHTIQKLRDLRRFSQLYTYYNTGVYRVEYHVFNRMHCSRADVLADSLTTPVPESNLSRKSSTPEGRSLRGSDNFITPRICHGDRGGPYDERY